MDSGLQKSKTGAKDKSQDSETMIQAKVDANQTQDNSNGLKELKGTEKYSGDGTNRIRTWITRGAGHRKES